MNEFRAPGSVAIRREKITPSARGRLKTGASSGNQRNIDVDAFIGLLGGLGILEKIFHIFS